MLVLDDSVRELELAQPMPCDTDDEIFKRLSAVEVWIARHDGICTERHSNQQMSDSLLRSELHEIAVKVGKLEMRVAYWAGAAAAVGGGIGGAITTFFAG